MPRGFIRKRSGPRGDAWELRVYLGVDELTGKERRLYRTVRGDEATAERALRKLLDEVDDEAIGSPEATFGTLLDEWQKLKARRWSPKTTLETAGMVRRHLEPLRGTQLRKITPRGLDAFYEGLLAKGYATSTVQRIQGVVRSALGQAVRWEWIARNPASRCEPIESVQAEPVPPKPDDVVRLLAYLITDLGDLALFVRLAAVTGRRRGELCALRWSDIDSTNDTVTASRTVVKGPDGWVERPISKNTKRFPPLALDAGTVTLLRAHRTATAERLLKLGLPLADDEHVFVSLSRDRRSTKAWSPDRVSHRFAAARAEVGLDKVKLHHLRHYVATTLLDNGYAAHQVGGRLGHGSGGRTTQEVYAHWLPATDRAAAELMGRLLDTPRSDSDVG